MSSACAVREQEITGRGGALQVNGVRAKRADTAGLLVRELVCGSIPLEHPARVRTGLAELTSDTANQTLTEAEFFTSAWVVDVESSATTLRPPLTASFQESASNYRAGDVFTIRVLNNKATSISYNPSATGHTLVGSGVISAASSAEFLATIASVNASGQPTYTFTRVPGGGGVASGLTREYVVANEFIELTYAVSPADPADFGTQRNNTWPSYTRSPASGRIFDIVLSLPSPAILNASGVTIIAVSVTYSLLDASGHSTVQAEFRLISLTAIGDGSEAARTLASITVANQTGIEQSDLSLNATGIANYLNEGGGAIPVALQARFSTDGDAPAAGDQIRIYSVTVIFDAA